MIVVYKGIEGKEKLRNSQNINGDKKNWRSDGRQSAQVMAIQTQVHSFRFSRGGEVDIYKKPAYY
jgi:hypothetical protein